jgi:pimeloyl-ACP methyl ester carboxylesterase
MLMLAVGVLAWALRHRHRVLALISEDALARYMDKQSEDPHSISAFGEIMRPIVLFALAWIGAKSAAAYFWMDGPKYLSLFDLGALLALLASYGYCITVQTRYRMSVALAARDAAEFAEQTESKPAAASDEPISRAA